MAHKKDESSRVEELELEIELKNIDAQLGQTKQLQKTQQDLKEACEKIGRLYKTQRNLFDQIDSLSENGNIDKCQAEIASIEQEKNLIKAKLAALQKDNEAVILEKEKLADDILVMKQSNEGLHNEIDKIRIELMKRDNELKQMTDKCNNKELCSETVRKIARKYKNLYFELQKKHDELVAEQAAKAFDQETAQSCPSNASTQTDESSDVSKELNSSIAEKHHQNEFLRAENDKLSILLAKLDAKHTAAMNTMRTMIEEKREERSKLRAIEIQSESRLKSSIDKDKENAVAMVRSTHEKDTLQTPILQMHRQSTSVPMIPSQKSPSDAGLTTAAKPITGK